MDKLTIGFISIIIIFMLIRFLFDLYMYRNSVYEVIYSSFTEYRMRRKSIEGMSESYQLTEIFGPHRIMYHINENGHGTRAAYATVLLTSGCYLIAINNGSKNIISEVKEFINQNIYNMLKNTVYQSLSFETSIIVILSNQASDSDTSSQKSKQFNIRRRDLINKIKVLEKRKKNNLSKTDIDGIFYAIAHESIESEKVSAVDVS